MGRTIHGQDSPMDSAEKGAEGVVDPGAILVKSPSFPFGPAWTNPPADRLPFPHSLHAEPFLIVHTIS
uniref:Uncharacterized protein n=1 Tax=Candidatus Kentrum sp. MB TaxID=2138164 RepID=A0A451B729_9GAMM|nr:MAG: hypothetical protein BECKMB1821G_GA0114241_100222 [Candidatus Kentron sp. MB]VFK28779.1 MAG: hypothetical protein BECKMB1821I_GA0114274_100723 [Candidatus Kentron sp. MB]VFK74092.1 MAG: hypothetical protein BECKMB1821H_GA0114242_100122 [Candidatus Kentron sp. MB]